MLPNFSRYHPAPHPVAPTMHACSFSSAFCSQGVVHGTTYNRQNQVIGVLHRTQTDDFEEVTRQCTNLTWSQVFLAVDRLSRSGETMLVPIGRGMYALTFRTGRTIGLIDAHCDLNHKEVILCLR
jgi:hypothetical protein